MHSIRIHMDRITLDKLYNREVDAQVKDRRTSELTIKIKFYEGGIRECRSVVEKALVWSSDER